MIVKDYLKRIKYTGDLSPRIDVLQKLQKSHLMYVPFENLDIHYNNTIRLKVDEIYSKVIEKKRGGFCYELNGLFHTLLERLGFDAKIISARVYNSDKDAFGKEYDHLAIIVKLLHKEYLVDVGFGEFTLHPLEIKLNRTQSDPRNNFIIEKTDNDYFQVSKIEDETKAIQYIFSNKKRDFSEFSEMCQYHQTDSDSHFTQKKLITKPTEMGRITITGNTLKITEKGEVLKEAEFDVKDYSMYLLDWFGIKETEI